MCPRVDGVEPPFLFFIVCQNEMNLSSPSDSLSLMFSEVWLSSSQKNHHSHESTLFTIFLRTVNIAIVRFCD
jgi:hypothetical protein